MANRLFILLLSLLVFISYASGEENDTINILFTANVNGNVADCGCSDVPLGGITRLKAYITNYKKMNPNTIVIDGGDFFNSYPFPEFNQLIARIIRLMPYDVLIPGDVEFVEGRSFVDEYFANEKSRLLFSNSRGESFQKVAEFEFGKRKIKIRAVLSPASFEYIASGNATHVISEVVSGFKNDHSFNILIFHGRLNELKRVVNIQGKPDLILLGHETLAEQTDLDGIPVFGARPEAESITLVRIPANGKVQGEQIPLGPSVIEDIQIKNMIASFEQSNRQVQNEK